MTFLRSLLRDTNVIVTDLYCQGINHLSLEAEQRGDKTSAHLRQPDMRQWAGFKACVKHQLQLWGVCMCLPSLVLNIIFLRLLITWSRRWILLEKVSFGVNRFCAVRMRQHQDDREWWWWATQRYKQTQLRGMKDKFPFTTSVIIQEEESDTPSSNNC